MAGQGAEATWLQPSAVVLLTGDEQFIGLDATVTDFWRWAFSDLRDNTTRGILAEFLVAKAVGDTARIRIGWANFDALAPGGTRIEVKCSAFLQSWTLKQLSELRFGRLRAREFDADRNEYSADVRVRADVFVFAVQTQRDPASYDMLDIRHWEFWVANASAVRHSKAITVGIGWVRRHAHGPLPYQDLAEAIRAAAAGNLPPGPPGQGPDPGRGKRTRVPLEQRLEQAGPDVLAVAQRLRSFAQGTDLTVVSGYASLGLHDSHGAIARIYPSYGSIAFALEPLTRLGHDYETAQIRSRLSQISSGTITRKEPSISCRDALASWDRVCEEIQVIVRLRKQDPAD